MADEAIDAFGVVDVVHINKREDGLFRWEVHYERGSLSGAVPTFEAAMKMVIKFSAQDPALS